MKWGTVTLVDAERRLLGNALLDFSNERFVLLSESCIPLYNFATIYDYLIGSTYSFLDSYDDPSRYGRGRYSRRMKSDIKLRDWRKGSQWFEIHRTLAIKIVSDTRYFFYYRSKFHYPMTKSKGYKMDWWGEGWVLGSGWYIFLPVMGCTFFVHYCYFCYKRFFVQKFFFSNKIIQDS